jgi:hypothetical protein
VPAFLELLVSAWALPWWARALQVLPALALVSLWQLEFVRREPVCQTTFQHQFPGRTLPRSPLRSMLQADRENQVPGEMAQALWMKKAVKGLRRWQT